MNKILILLFLAMSSIAACKKDKSISFKQFDDITNVYIENLKNEFSSENIMVISSGLEEGLKPGAILFYQTDEGFFGKLKIVGATTDPNSSLVIDIVTYKPNETVQKNITINLGYGCDLDSGVTAILGNDNEVFDFFWGSPNNSGNYYIYHFIPTTFYIYSK